uniref:Upstream-binding protein 1 n=2 Tax=Bactrocera latifrons TaxID=174628 RepID=A0A0K8VTH7_BACLA
MKIWPNSPVHIPKYDGILPYTGGSPVTNSSPIAINSVTSTNSPTLKLMEANMVSPQQSATPDMDDYTINILPESSPSQVSQWLSHHRLTSYLSTFLHFSGSDIMRMSKEDLIQICGLADGIRMFNILRAKYDHIFLFNFLITYILSINENCVSELLHRVLHFM